MVLGKDGQFIVTHDITMEETILPNRFPFDAGQRVVRLADELQLIAGLNKTTNKNAGLYIEPKSPSFHKKEFAYSMGEALMKLLATHEVKDRCFIQCFEMEERQDLHDRLNCKLPLIALLGRRPTRLTPSLKPSSCLFRI